MKRRPTGGHWQSTTQRFSVKTHQRNPRKMISPCPVIAYTPRSATHIDLQRTYQSSSTP